jgi:hypothetical protein
MKETNPYYGANKRFQECRNHMAIPQKSVWDHLAIKCRYEEEEGSYQANL